jgi:hypothetical protein
MTEQFISELSKILNDNIKSSKITLQDFNNISENIQNNNNLQKFNFNTLLSNMKYLFENNQTEISKEDFISKAKEIIIKNNLYVIAVNSEKIINDLNEIKNEAKNQNDIETIEDLEYIVKLIQTENIYDSDPMFIINNEHNKDGIKFLMQFSLMDDKKRRAKDFKLVRSNTISVKKKIGIIKNKNINNENNIIHENDNSNYNNNNNYDNTIIKSNILSNFVTKEIYSPKRRSSLNQPQSLKIPPEIHATLFSLISRIEYTDYDIFSLDLLLEKKGPLITALEILDRLDIVKQEVIETNTLKNFIKEAINNYSRTDAIYHNDLHAADVMQTLFTMMIRGKLVKKMKLTEIDKFSMLIGALCHDLKHTGQNNMFHINTKSKIAIRYNDISVLENYHIANTFKLMKNDKFDILKKFKPEEYRLIRRRIIDGILATDMANHQKVLSEMKKKIEFYGVYHGKNFKEIFNVSNEKLFDAQQVVLNMCIHTADISNPAKPEKISKKWTEKVYDEFFKQGDLEKQLNLPVSLLCDRNTTNINKAMIGFINFVVMPTIDMLCEFIPEVGDYGRNIKNNLKMHQLGWEEDQKKEKENKEKENKETENKKENENDDNKK